MLLFGMECKKIAKSILYWVLVLALLAVSLYQYDPTVESTTGIMVPVWDVFGGSQTEYEDHTEINTGEHSRQSMLTINALDGTIIDRGLGY